MCLARFQLLTSISNNLLCPHTTDKYPPRSCPRPFHSGVSFDHRQLQGEASDNYKKRQLYAEDRTRLSATGRNPLKNPVGAKV